MLHPGLPRSVKRHGALRVAVAYQNGRFLYNRPYSLYWLLAVA